MNTIGGGDEIQELVYKACVVLKLPINFKFTYLYHRHCVVMHKELTPTFVPTDQPPLTQQPFANQMQIQEEPLDSSQSNSIVWSKGYHDGSPFYTGPVYQGMGPNDRLQEQYRPPSSRPSRRKGSRKAAHPYRNHSEHESSGVVQHDHSTGANPGMARNNARNNPRRGKVWRTPSKNLFMTDCNLT